jgi:murein DD-endopeptidase MepM/ murein hydrolase activator NlpD
MGTGETPVSRSRPWRCRLLALVIFAAAGGLFAAEPLLRAVDLEIGESAEVELSDGSSAKVKLISVDEVRDPLRDAVRRAEVTVEVNGATVRLEAANYQLPVAAGGVQIDCTITAGYLGNTTRNIWGLKKDARLRLWPKDSPWVAPGTFVYPVKQRWFASGTQFSNEPTFVDGGEVPANKKIYYHNDLDFGGCEGMVDVVAATDGLVVSASDQTLPKHALNTPARKRYDVVYVLDDRGWYYRYSHLYRIDVKLGQRVKMGDPIGVLGKEGGSGGWSHLHFGITSRQPSGEWGTQEGYAFIWQAYLAEHEPKVIAVARPHHLVWAGTTVTLDGSKSWSANGEVAGFEWEFTDGSTGAGAKVERRYEEPGHYSEILKVTDSAGEVSFDFAVVQVVDEKHPEQVPPSIQAAYAPSLGLRVGDAVAFKVRTFRTTEGEETWDFGDGSPPVTVRSDGNAETLAKDGFAVTEHVFEKPGDYIVRVQRTNGRGETAIAYLWVPVKPTDE